MISILSFIHFQPTDSNLYQHEGIVETILAIQFRHLQYRHTLQYNLFQLLQNAGA